MSEWDHASSALLMLLPQIGRGPRRGGIFALSNTTSGGLAAHIKLQRPRQMPPVPASGAAEAERKVAARESAA